MGVLGAGKTTVGTLLAEKLGWRFADADDFHSEANKTKIARGIALADADRGPWLAALHAAIEKWNTESQDVVLACSALKETYRKQLQTGPVRFVHLKGTPDLIAVRLQSRRGHYATDSILQSQFADLEQPHDAIAVSIDNSPQDIAAEIIEKLKATHVAS